MNAQEIIAYIAAAEKKTPVKVYINELADIDYGEATVFGEGRSKVVFGDWRQLEPILTANAGSIADLVVENDRRNSAIPLLDMKGINARIEPGAIIREQVEIGDNAVIMMGAVINIGAVIGPGTMIDMGAILGGRATWAGTAIIGAEPSWPGSSRARQRHPRHRGGQRAGGGQRRGHRGASTWAGARWWPPERWSSRTCRRTPWWQAAPPGSSRGRTRAPPRRPPWRRPFGPCKAHRYPESGRGEVSPAPFFAGGKPPLA